MKTDKIALAVRLEQMTPTKHANKALECVADFATHRDVVLKWKKVIRHLEALEKAKVAEGTTLPDQLHPLIAGFPTGFFMYLFDPYKAAAFIKEKEIHPIKLPAYQLIKTVDQQQLDPLTRFEPNDRRKPIIVLESPLFNHPFCISGNLRIADAYKKSKETILKVHYVMAEDYLHFMHDDLSKAMHMFHMDVQTLATALRLPQKEKLQLYRLPDYVTLPDELLQAIR